MSLLARRLSSGAPVGADWATAVAAVAPSVWWRLGETSGTSAADSSGNARPGTYNGAVSLGEPGAITTDADTAVHMDSVEYVRAEAYIANWVQATIIVWVNLAAWPVGGRGCAAGFFNGTYGALAYDKLIMVSSSGQPYAYAYPGVARTTSAPTASLALNTWHMLALTVDGVTLRCFLDGVQVGSVACGNTFDGFTQPNLFVHSITPSDGPATKWMPGTFDEFVAKNSALTPTQITDLYAAA
jgi:hypothetical protein